jgi:hypothetical protein
VVIPVSPGIKHVQNAFHQGKEEGRRERGRRKKKKYSPVKEDVEGETTKQRQLIPNGLKAVHDNGTHQVARRTNCCFNKSVTQ